MGFATISEGRPYFAEAPAFSTTEFYDDIDRGRSQNPNIQNRQLDALVLRLDVERERQLVEFLGALSDDSFDRTIPQRVPSGLNPGGNTRNLN